MLITNCILKFHRRFDVNRFLDVFDLIKLKSGVTLDYEYLYDEPIVYTRKKVPLPKLFKSKKTKHSDAIGPFNFFNIQDILFAQSPEGYFQFAVFSVVVSQFYLYWHALTNDLVFIYSKKQIEDILKNILKVEYEGAIMDKDINNDLFRNEREKMAEAELSAIFQNRETNDDISIFLGPLREDSQRDIITGEIIPIQRHWTSKEELEALFSTPLNPQVTIMENGYGVVKILSFSKWSGFEYRHYYVKWPNLIEKVQMETILKYNCGITAVPTLIE